MSRSYSPSELAESLGAGLLSFPVTHFSDDLKFDEDGYRRHIRWQSKYAVAGLFVAGGTGEFFSLTQKEVSQIIAAAVNEDLSIPIVAPAGYGIATAIEMVKSAEKAGAQGILLFPPYLTESEQEGLAAYILAVCKATSLGVVVYNRANARYADTTIAQVADQCPNLVGFKDGSGDIEQLVRIRLRLGDRLVYIGGLPTAELFAVPYQDLGMSTYSSAIFNFVPEFAIAFFDAVRAMNYAMIDQMLREFIIPYSDIRNRRAGYAVSIIKAGLKVVGRSAGPVRPPLTNLESYELAELETLISGLKVPFGG